MKTRLLLYVVTFASLPAMAQSTSDEIWRGTTCARGLQDKGVSCSPLHGAFNLLEEKPFRANALYDSLRSGNYVVPFTDGVGIGVTRNESVRAFGLVHGRPNGGMWLLGAQRNSVLRQTVYGLSFQYRFH
jgi:hypothetical protein